MGEGPEVSAAIVDGRGGVSTPGSGVFFEKAGVPTEGKKSNDTRREGSRGAHGGSGKRNARGVRTDAVQVRLKVHRCLLAVGLEPFQHHLFDVHIAVARKSSRCQDL